MFDQTARKLHVLAEASKESASGLQFVSKPVKVFAQRLRSTPGKNVWLMGGGELAKPSNFRKL